MIDLHCRRCRVVLGQTDGRQLHVGGLVFARPVTFACAGCGQRRVFVPEKVAKRVLIAA